MGPFFHRALVPLALVLALPMVAQEDENLFLKRRALPARTGPHALSGHDRADLRQAWSLWWFGGMPSPEYLDFKNEAASRERGRWANLFPTPASAAHPLALQSLGPSASGITGTWINLGPTSNLINASFPDVDTGRPVAIVAHPTANTLYLADNGGGVFRCDNADPASTTDWVWTPITDSLPNSSSSGNLGLGAMAMSPADPKVLYIGAGDVFDAQGRGFYKTTDGGSTWTAATSGLGAATFSTAILPLSASTIFWGTNDGLKVSANGGSTFTQVTVGTTTTGRVWTIQKFSSSDLVLSLQAGTQQAVGAGSIYYSSNGGTTWTQANLSGTGLPTNIGRITIAAAGDGLTAYALLEDNTSTSASVVAKGILKSTDKGVTWTWLAAPVAPGSLFQGTGPYMTDDGGQGWYNHALTVDPNNPSRLFAGSNLALYRSSDGGTTWAQMTHWGAAGHVYAHSDFHTTAWSASGAILYVGDDGGLSVIRDPFRAIIPSSATNGSVPSDPTFIDNRRNKGLTTHLIYSVGSTTATSPADSKYRISLGLQDNGTRVRQPNTTGGTLTGTEGTFEDGIGGDGIGTLIHPVDGTQFLGSVYYADIYKSTDGGTTFKEAITGLTEANSSTDAPFYSRLVPGLKTAPNTVYTFVNTKVYVSTDFATTWSALGTSGLSGLTNAASIRQIGASSTDPNALGIVATGGRVFLSYNGGTSWNAAGTPLGNGYSMSFICFDPNNSNTVYVASVALGATYNHLWKSTNGGTSWSALDGSATTSNGLPFGIPIHVVRLDPTNASKVYVGTDFGVYSSSDAGTTWTRFGIGLPMVTVRDLYIAPDGTFLRAGSFGRGVWELQTGVSAGPSVTLSPAAATLVNGGTQGFTPTVSNGTTGTVTWTATVGTIAAGPTANGMAQTYTSPASGTTATVTATTVDTPVSTSSATLTLVAPSAVTVAVSPATFEMMTGTGTEAFSATVTPLTNTAVTWTGTGVNGSGTFSATGLAAGSYPVTATSQAAPTRSGSATVTLVTAASVTVTVTPTNGTAVVGGTAQFTATVSGLSTANQGVTWSVSGGGTINATGLFSATTAGTYTVTATNTFSGRTGTASIIVSPAPPSVTVAPTTATMVYGGTQAFTPTVSNGTTSTVTWSASSGTIGAGPTGNSVAQTYTAPASGSTATVTATTVDTPAAFSSATVTLVAPGAVNVVVAPATFEMVTGTGTKAFSAALTPLTNTAVTWTGTGVNSSGTFSATGLAAGTYTVTAASQAAPTRSGSATVTLIAPSSITIALSPASAGLLVGGTAQFSATVSGLSAANQGVTWSVNGGGSISSTGLFTATTFGTFTVTATNTFSGQVGTASITVRGLDLNADGVADLRDLLFFAKYYGTATASCDLNGDGLVNDADLSLLLAGL